MIRNSSKILTEKVLKNLGIPAVCTVARKIQALWKKTVFIRYKTGVITLVY